MKKVNLRELNDSDIQKQIDESRKQLRELRFQFAVARSVENPSAFRVLKKKIAQLLTVQHERKKGLKKS